MSSKRVGAAIAVVATLASVAAASVAARTSSSATPVAGVNSLNSIACPTEKTCVAVGIDNDQSGKSATIAAASGQAKAWSGTIKDDPMNAVACAGKNSCLAVADGVVATVGASSAAMKVTAVPKKPKTGILAVGQIACAGTKRCYAVGFEGTEGHSNALVLTLSPAGKLLSNKKDQGTGIGAIACPSSALCLMGDARTSGEVIQLLNSGKPGASHPLPAHTYDQSMSCYKAKLCYVLGGTSTGNTSETDELFPLNPKTGKIGSKATIKNFSGNDISCISATTCLVSGFTLPFSVSEPAIVAVVKGKAGKPVTYPTSNSGNFHAVACVGTSECYAVGSSSSGAIVEKVKS